MNLWLFDIDGTLVNITQVHLNTYKKIYRDFVHADVSDDVLLPTFGMTEHDLHPIVFKKLRLKVDEKLVHRMTAANARYFKTELTAHDVDLLPGVKEFFNYLTRKKQAHGVVTGNLKENAELILRKAKLFHSFDFIATDDGTKMRWQIVKDAIKIARKKGFVWKSVVVIGDTISDIEAARRCAKETGEKIIAVAVATGTCSYELLKQNKPDVLLRTMKEYSSIIEFVENAV